MTYPPSNPGYPPAPQSGSQFDATQQFAKAVPAPASSAPAPAAAAPGENKLPEILLAVVAVTGLLTYFVSFALDIAIVVGTFIVPLALAAGLVAGVSVLPKQKNRVTAAVVLSTVAFLLSIPVVLAAPGSDSDWALYAMLVLTLIQAGAAIAALLFEAGIITPPAPKPQFDQQPQYGQYGGPSQYYGQQHQPQHGGQPYQQAQSQPSYPSQYGGYASGPSTGGYPVQSPQSPQGQQPSGPPTPPTGYPTYGQPQSGSSAPAGGPAQQPPSQQSGPAPS
ncbi:DUF5336 domain-containing protein [Mycobacterium sp. DL440]|uniref:DUF5336 domain-containing protein n=1 Tax=Mycobacterium sp. DL440 TaxID=2675523 RepID=UPI001422D385|nr:DUF5336 domain-containing protein [Mycobacterium sp. DL440]